MDQESILFDPSSSNSINIQNLCIFLNKNSQSIGLQQQATPQNLVVKQFARGQSNPTYRLKINDWVVVLRRAPYGKLLKGAHAVEREYQIFKALYGRAPVPQPYVLCMDPNVIGSKFFIMECIDGVAYDPSLPDHSPPQRTHLYTQLVSTLVSIHSVPLHNLPFAPLTPNQYTERQTQMWARQFLASLPPTSATPPHEFTLLYNALKLRAPVIDAANAAPTLTHGDYRLDNVLFVRDRAPPSPHPTYTLGAVIDWELATLGDPLADVAYLAASYYLPESLCGPGMPGISQPTPRGIPSDHDLMQLYCTLRGIQMPDQSVWGFYKALAVFRIAGILAGIGGRVRAGNASHAGAAMLQIDENVSKLLKLGLEMVGVGQFAPSTSSSTQTERGSTLPSTAAPSHPPNPDLAPFLTRIPTTPTLPQLSPKARQILTTLTHFMTDYIYPAERHLTAHTPPTPPTGPSSIPPPNAMRWTIPPVVAPLQQQARDAGLWNLWIPPALSADIHAFLKAHTTLDHNEITTLAGPGLTNVEYGLVAQLTGRSIHFAPEVLNCMAPGTGNMELLAMYGTVEQKKAYLVGMLQGEVKSCFAMTEPGVASSDALNIACEVLEDREGGLVVRGRKWWISGIMDPRCKVCFLLGRHKGVPAITRSPRHRQHSIVVFPLPPPSGGSVDIIRPMLSLGYDDAPHGHAEVLFNDVKLRADDVILGARGRGFQLAQSRLGPGRIHHCMRAVGMAERALGYMMNRANSRQAFGSMLASNDSVQRDIAHCRIKINAAQLLVLAAAAEIDEVGAAAARHSLAIAKVHVPRAVQHVVDRAMQVHGAMGLSQDTELPRLWVVARQLRYADGPDEVHERSIGRRELKEANAKL